jgi:hypothetical protein
MLGLVPQNMELFFSRLVGQGWLDSDTTALEQFHNWLLGNPLPAPTVQQMVAERLKKEQHMSPAQRQWADVQKNARTQDGSPTVAAAVAPTSPAGLQGRRLATSGDSSVCSGRGQLANPIQNPVAYACNGIPVSGALSSALFSSPLSPGPLTAALLGEALTNTSVVVIMLGGDRPFPASVNLTTLAGVQQGILVSVANVSNIEGITSLSQVLTPDTNPVEAALVLSSLGGDNLVALANGTTCVAINSTAPTGTCVCPFDAYGPQCEFSRMYTCAVVLQDSLYHACQAVNGFGFDIPSGEAQAEDTFSGLGPHSGVAQPTSIDALSQAWDYLGVARPREGANWQRVPPPRDRSSPRGYRAYASGIPPCLFLHRKQAETAIVQNKGLVPLKFRVSCQFADRNASSHLTSGAVFTDPLGLSYIRQAYLDPASVGGVVATASSVPVLGGLPSYACNGTVLTSAVLSSLLAAQGYNISTAPGPAPYYGLPCVEQNFTYIVGGQPSFALSVPPALPLAVRVRALPNAYISDVSGVSTTVIPVSALTGEQDITVYLNVSNLAATSAYWAGGRLHLEAQTIMLPEGWQVSPHTPDTVRTLVVNNDTGPVLSGLGYDASGTPINASTLSIWVSGMNMSYTPSLLVLSNVHPITVDDAGYEIPTQTSYLDVLLGLVLGLGLPLVLGVGGTYTWYKRRKLQEAEREREAIQDRLMAEQQAREDADRDIDMRSPLPPITKNTMLPPVGSPTDTPSIGLELVPMHSRDTPNSRGTVSPTTAWLRSGTIHSPTEGEVQPPGVPT